MIQETAHSALGSWESFYVIVGSSAAALTGLQFVVITLVSEARRGAGTTQIDAFATPTIVHFCAALLVSVTLSAPWPYLFGPAFVISTCGLVGALYTGVVVVRARRQTGYTMVAEDWTWHVVLPLVAYVAQAIAGLMLRRATHPSLFVIGATALLLVFIGIHNAWDTTTYVVANPDAIRKLADATASAPATPSTEPKPE